MDQHIIYWASAGLHSEFARTFLEAAESLSETGITVDHRQMGSSLWFSSPELGNFQLDRADIFGYLTTQRPTPLASLLLLTASAINPTLLLLAHDRRHRCTPESKRRFLQASIRHLEMSLAERIMVAYDLYAETPVQEKPSSPFGKTCQSLAA